MNELGIIDIQLHRGGGHMAKIIADAHTVVAIVQIGIGVGYSEFLIGCPGNLLPIAQSLVSEVLSLGIGREGDRLASVDLLPVLRELRRKHHFGA